LEFRSSATVSVFADLYGYYAPAVASRSGRFVLASSVTSVTATVAPGGSASFDLTSGVPSGVEAVLVSFRASGAAGTWSRDGLDLATVRDGESSLNQVVMTGRTLTVISTSGGTASVDVVGWFTGSSSTSSAEGLFVVESPRRVFDTSWAPNPLGVGVALHQGWTAELEALVTQGSAVVSNVVVTNAHGSGDVVVHPARRDRGRISVVSPGRAGRSLSGQVTTGVSARSVAVWSQGGADLAVDIVGWFTGSPLVATSGAPVNPLPVGDTFPGQIWIPDIKLRSTVRENADFVDFDPVHIPESRSPNQPGNVAIFGHRTSHGREFRNIDRLKRGSQIVLTTNGRNYTYSVTAVGVLKPDDPALWTSSSNDQTLTLVACHPPGSVRFRIVAFARLTSVT